MWWTRGFAESGGAILNPRGASVVGKSEVREDFLEELIPKPTLKGLREVSLQRVGTCVYVCAHVCAWDTEHTLANVIPWAEARGEEHRVQGGLQASCSCRARRSGVARDAAGRTDYRDSRSFVLMTGSLLCRWWEFSTLYSKGNRLSERWATCSSLRG